MCKVIILLPVSDTTRSYYSKLEYLHGHLKEAVSYNLVLITDSEGIKHPTRSLCSHLILGFASSASFFFCTGENWVWLLHMLLKVNLIQLSLRYTYNGHTQSHVSNEAYTIKEVMMERTGIKFLTIFSTICLVRWTHPHLWWQVQARWGKINICTMTTTSHFSQDVLVCGESNYISGGS